MIGQTAVDPGPIDLLRHRRRVQVQVAVFKPTANRDSEALFRPIDYLVRNEATDGLLENIFRDAAPKLVTRRNSTGEIDDVDVEERTTSLKPVHHTGPICLDQNVILEVKPNIKLNGAVDVGFRRRMVPGSYGFGVKILRVRF